MTLIKEFKIVDLAGRSGTTHHKLNPGTNILWGLNGSGKTTLLKILHSALLNDTSGLEKLPFTSAEIHFYNNDLKFTMIRKYKKPSRKTRHNPTTYLEDRSARLMRSLDSEFEPIEFSGPERGNAKWVSTVSGVENFYNGVKLLHKYLPISREQEPASFYREADITPEDHFVYSMNRIWSKYRTQSLAQVRDVQQKGLAGVLEILFTGEPSRNMKNQQLKKIELREAPEDAFNVVKQFLKDQGVVLPLNRGEFTQKYEESRIHRYVVTLIRQVMSEVEKIYLPQRELQAVINEMFMGNKNVLLNSSRQLRVEVNREYISLGSLSSGEKQLLHILLQTLSAGKSLIIIDEPELSLHPDWQLGLVDSMRRVNGEAQFILASHSPEVMVGVDEECVFEL